MILSAFIFLLFFFLANIFYLGTLFLVLAPRTTIMNLGSYSQSVFFLSCLLIESVSPLIIASKIFYLALLSLEITIWASMGTYLFFGLSWALAINILFFSSFMVLSFWNRDLFREIPSHEGSICIISSILVFIFSEGILFLSIFWGYYHSAFSPFTLGPHEGYILVSRCEITYYGSFLLSLASVCGGYNHLAREKYSLGFSALPIAGISLLFVILQAREYRILDYCISDNIYGCLFFYLTAAHYFHLLAGILLLGLIFSSLFFICFTWGHNNPCIFYLSPQPQFSGFSRKFATAPRIFFTGQLLYWHFIEYLWVIIDLVLYFS